MPLSPPQLTRLAAPRYALRSLRGSHAVSKYKNPKSLFRDSEVAATWDPKISARKNLSKLGLVGNANDDIKRPSQQEFVTSGALNPVELYDVPADGRVRNCKKVRITFQFYIVNDIILHSYIN